MASEQNASEQQHEYGASDITVLEGLEAGDVMRLGDLQRSAMAMLNVIKDSEVFEVTLDRIIENSDDAEQVAEAQAAKDVLAQEKAN